MRQELQSGVMLCEARRVEGLAGDGPFGHFTASEHERYMEYIEVKRQCLQRELDEIPVGMELEYCITTRGFPQLSLNALTNTL